MNNYSAELLSNINGKKIIITGYNGYIGIEYEGDEIGEKEGVIATRNLLLNAAKRLN